MRLTDSRILAIKPPETGQDEHKDDLVQGLRLRAAPFGCGRMGSGGDMVMDSAGLTKCFDALIGRIAATRNADVRAQKAVNAALEKRIAALEKSR